MSTASGTAASALASRNQAEGRELGGWPTVTLTALTVAVAVGLGRLFAGSSGLGAILIAAVSAHGLAWAARRLGLGTPKAALLSALGLLLYTAWVIEPHTTAFGLPGTGTARAVWDDLANAWDLFGRVVAPVPADRGFVLASAAAIWSTAFLADWAAFRLNVAFEALVPSFSVFLFASALGPDSGRIMASGLYLTAALAFLLVHTAARRAESSAWFASRMRGGPQAIVQGGTTLGIITLAVALVLGPLLPGAGDPPVLDWRGGDGGGSRLTESPLVSIRSRLVSQSNTEVFAVRSTARSYWRLTALDTFDGEVWGSRGSYRKAGAALPEGVPSRARRTETTQQFTIKALSSIWLPAAYRPDAFPSERPGGVSYDPESASLLTEELTSDGMEYTVRSALPALSAQQLGAVPDRAPRDIQRRYLDLPSAFPDRVRRLARQLTVRRQSPYDRAKALQDWFRANFTYSQSVVAGHSDSAIERFLFDRREGYCEQFAGSYAAMARSIGLPARVAVGFTPGELGRDGLYHVTGKQAHAWPEVYLTGFGWVAFEPTPGRGAPGAERYTGVPEQQQTEAGVTVETTSTTTATTQPQNGNSRPRVPRERDVESGRNTGGVAGRSPWPGRLVVAAIVLGVVLVVFLIGMPLSYWLRRRRRRARVVTPTDRTLLAWVEATESLAVAGLARQSWETPTEYARRATEAANLPSDLLSGLARDTAAAAYSEGGVPDEVGARSAQAAAAVASSVAERTTRAERVLHVWDPRPLLRRSGEPG